MEDASRTLLRLPPSENLLDDRRCFACGPDNADGLRLQFVYGEASAEATFVPHKRFAGWTTMLHGGILATLLDEAMAHAAIAAGVRAVTGKLEIRFRRPAPLGATLIARGRLESRRGRMLQLSATVQGEDGILYASSQGRFVADDSGQANGA